MSYTWDFSSILQFWPALLRGLGVTLWVASASSLLGTLTGVLCGVLIAQSRLLATVGSLAIDVVRSVPNLVLIFACYYFPFDQIFGTSPLSAETSAILGLSIAQCAYTADLIRGSLRQVPRALLLGFEGLGMPRKSIVRHIVIPFVTRQVLPAHIALWIGNLKLSSLASVIGVNEVVYVARFSIAQTFRSFEAWVVVALIYACLVVPLTLLARRLEAQAWFSRQ